MEPLSTPNNSDLNQIPQSLIPQVPVATITQENSIVPTEPGIIAKNSWLKISLIILVAFALFGIGMYLITHYIQSKNIKSNDSIITEELQTEVNVPKESLKGLPGFTEIKNGHLLANQSISVPISIDTVGSNMFYLTWIGEKPTLTLTNPEGITIDDAYAKKYPDQVKFEYTAGSPETPPMIFSTITTSQLGAWKMNITAKQPIDYMAFGIITSGPTLKVGFNASVYKVGDIARITANITSTNQLENLIVVATITTPDSKKTTLNLIDQGNGIYSNTYVVPDLSGYLTASIVVKGTSNGVPFTREGLALSSINDQNALFTGKYSEKAVDSNGDGLFDSLDFMFEVNSKVKGSFSISAELNLGEQVITQRGDFFDLKPGLQTLTLSFDGSAISKSKLDGPYTITSLFMTPIDTGVTSDQKVNVLSTSAYKFSSFKLSR